LYRRTAPRRQTPQHRRRRDNMLKNTNCTSCWLWHPHRVVVNIEVTRHDVTHTNTTHNLPLRILAPVTATWRMKRLQPSYLITLCMQTFLHTQRERERETNNLTCPLSLPASYDDMRRRGGHKRTKKGKFFSLLTAPVVTRSFLDTKRTP
jgi:hypothetical protein